jgi:uncharacterized protein with GYD domain
MPKYLIRARYTPPVGVQGLLEEGATGRREAVDKLCESLGGKVESFYYAFGDTDVFTIVELPNNAAAAALSLIVGSSGEAQTTITTLLSADEIDEARKLRPSYRPPGDVAPLR